jgi:hypothetical protein
MLNFEVTTRPGSMHDKIIVARRLLISDNRDAKKGLLGAGVLKYAYQYSSVLLKDVFTSLHVEIPSKRFEFFGSGRGVMNTFVGYPPLHSPDEKVAEQIWRHGIIDTRVLFFFYWVRYAIAKNDNDFRIFLCRILWIWKKPECKVHILSLSLCLSLLLINLFHFILLFSQHKH